jgi:hypothetical protein
MVKLTPNLNPDGMKCFLKMELRLFVITTLESLNLEH